MVQLHTNSQSVPEQSANDSSVIITRSKIGAIMDKYRARIEDINSKTTDKNFMVSATESNTDVSEIINKSKLQLQKANTVMDGIGNDVRKLEAYSKVLMMVRRSLTSAERNYSYLLIKKQ